MAIEDISIPSATVVLVTGGTGFVATHLILELLAAGYTVRTTVRCLSKEADARELLLSAGADADALASLSFFPADLNKDDGWDEAVAGCTYVYHVAAPFPGRRPVSEDEILLPTRDGALRVLRAARLGGVKRVVLTSSFATIGYGQPKRKDSFTEEDWTVTDGKIPIPIFHKSKTLAEKAAWGFMEREGGALELAVVNSGAVIGPVLGANFSASIQLVQKLMDGSTPACPQLYYSFVDVRDLAELHIRAMVTPGAKGQRFIAIADGGPKSLLEVAKIIKQGRPDKAGQVPTKQVADMVVKIMANVNPGMRDLVPQLGVVRLASNEKAKTTLGWKPRPMEQAILDTVDSLVVHHVV